MNLNKSSNSLDSVIAGMFDGELDTDINPHLSSMETLNTSAIKSISSYLHQEDGSLLFKCKNKSVTKNKIKAMLLSSNENIDIDYSDELEGNDLIHKSKNPLWILNQKSNGVFQLQRQQ